MATTTDQTQAKFRDDDVIRKLMDQHSRIRGLFEDVKNSLGEERQSTFEELRGLMVVHETAEEMIVRPVIRDLLGNREPNTRNAEEAEATKGLDRLSELRVDDPEFLTQLRLLEDAVEAHAQAEETHEFQAIAESCTPEDRASMGRQLDAALKIAPTRPHPGLMGHETAQLTLGPIAALVDRTRDAIKNAMK